ncbi:hypothetical protein [Cloacibacillus porcorum]|uniref:hypothetical protein n=1 Tax=Cloacibacillus porcorum TaxID=1197717 RepID=UPI0026740571|nr:hypothetical protein [Cloacibacillus porcorum]
MKVFNVTQSFIIFAGAREEGGYCTFFIRDTIPVRLIDSGLTVRATLAEAEADLERWAIARGIKEKK